MTGSNHERLRRIIQKALDDAGDGWSVAEWVVCMYIERIDPSTGAVDVEPWWYAPPNQGECRTDGVINSVLDQRSTAVYDTD